MLSHPDLLRAVSELHTDDLIREAERRSSARQVARQTASDALVRDRTVIMIAHRLSTVAGADQILVMDQGRVVQRGTHETLRAADGLYARMWQALEATERITLGDAVHGRVADGPREGGESG
jgi:ABC-type multidrug transport system ATPase subunit